MRMMLTLPEREEISRGLAEGLLYKEIGVVIGRDPSIISREVGRHGGRAAYRAVGADTAATVSRARPKLFAVERSDRLRQVVAVWLRSGVVTGLDRGSLAGPRAGRSGLPGVTRSDLLASLFHLSVDP